MSGDIRGLSPADHSFLAAAFCLLVLGVGLCVVFARLESLVFRKALARDQEALRLWSKRLADAAFDGLVIHRNGVILGMNRALLRLLGYRESEVLGQNFATFAQPAQSGALRAELEAPGNEIMEFTLITVDKAERRVEMSSQTIEHEGLPATVTAVRDITRASADRERIELLLHYDPMTGLANRALFSKNLAAAVALNDSAGGTTALFVMDVDHLSAVNERLGRAAGDQLLRQIASRIKGLAHQTDTVARISGDKFAIVQPHQGAPNRAQALAVRLDTVLAQAFVVDGQMVKPSMSIGMAIYPDHATDAEGLLRAASFALKRATQSGGGAFHVFSHAEAQAAEAQPAEALAAAAPAAAVPAAGSPASATPASATPDGATPDGAAPAGAAPPPGRTLPLRASHHFAPELTASVSAPALAQDLRVAIRRGEISVEYQPVFRARDLSLAGFEALARWRHPLHGWIPPSTFIPLAESAGVIHEIGSFVLEAACTKAAAAGPASEYVMAVNLSPLQFRDKQLAPQISEILRRTCLNPALLELEVTESLLIEDAEAARASLKALREIGVSVALDDFGTGFSSLSYLCDFPFTRLKIDKRFVHALGKDQNAEAVIAAILSLARNLKLEVTAEGVETAEQLSILQELGCHLVQGFLLGRPGTHVANMQALVKAPTGPIKPSLVIAN